MSTATVIAFTVRRKWVPVEYCRRCGESLPIDHTKHRMEIVR